MIHYQLCCGADHAFDGWFRDSAAFDSQAAAGLVACPACGTTQVCRALMAPAVGRVRRRVPRQEPTPAKAVVPPPEASARPMPDEMRAVLQKLRAEIETRCDNVGDQFAREARRIHHGETPARGIYGDATPEQAEELAEDGISVSRIPWVPRAEG